MVIKDIFSKLIDFIYPAQCFLCKKILLAEDGICFDCLSKLNYITDPRCARCGYPFEFAMKTKNVNNYCPNCIKKLPKFDVCISSLHYNDASKKIILPFKHGDKTGYAKFMSRVMSASGKKIIEKSDIIIPVPIHLTRMLKRKYNQASLLAKYLSKLNNIPAFYTCLLRTKATISQGHLSPRARKLNIKEAFKCSKSINIKGKTILLVDDVFTSGATVEECSKVLKQAGAKQVMVLTFARVIK